VVRLLGIVPALLLLSGLLAVLAGPLAASAAASAPAGVVVAWGHPNHGETEVPAGLSDVTAIAAGGYHSLALKSDGTVVAWGANIWGQTDVPAGLSGVTAIAAGGYHSLALKSDGTVVAWGANIWGQTTVPAGLSGVTAIAAGGYHSLALKSDGTVVAWGANIWGQTDVPAGLSGVTAIAAGWGHSLALKSDGTVVAWGRDPDLGAANATVPAGLSGVIAIAAGYSHSLALKSDGTVVAWGRYYSGSYDIAVPAGLSGVTAIAAGIDYDLAIAPPPGAPTTTSSLLGSVPTPAQITLDPVIVAESAVITAGVIIFVPFPGMLFNRTFEENYPEIAGRVRRSRRRLGARRRLRALAISARHRLRLPPASPLSEPLPSDPAHQRDATDPEPEHGTEARLRRSPLGIALFLAVSTLLYGLLDPTLGLSLGSLATLAGLAVGLEVTLLAFCVPIALMYRRKAIGFSVQALPGGLVVGLACVLVTRLTDYQPGYLYGLIVAIIAARKVSVAVDGKAMAMAATSTFVVAVVAWFGLLWVAPLRPAQGDQGLTLIAMQTAFVMAVVAGVELTFFGMLPLRFLPGEKVFRWNRLVWAVLFGSGMFGFAHVLMNPRNGYLADSTRTPLVTVVALLIFFGLSSTVFWAYFRFRPRPVAPAAT
jgi:hypothetical protein